MKVKDHHIVQLFLNMTAYYKHIWRKKAIPEHLHVSKKSQDNSDMHLDFKKRLQVFLLDPTFGNTEFYYFSVDQS